MIPYRVYLRIRPDNNWKGRKPNAATSSLTLSIIIKSN